MTGDGGTAASEAKRRAAVAASALLAAEAEPMWDELALHARLAVGTTMAAVTAVTGDDVHIVGASGVQRRIRARAISFCGQAILEPAKILCVPDAALDARFADRPAVLGAPWLRFYTGVPLVWRGLALGVLCVGDPQPRDGLLPREAAALRALAAEAVDRLDDDGDRPRPD